MGQFTQLVDPQINLREAAGEGARMVAWLQARGIIGSGRRRDEVWQEQFGHDSGHRDDTTVYPPGSNFREAHEESYAGDKPNGDWLVVIAERGVYPPGGSFEILCPCCGKDQVKLGDAWSEVIDAWYHGWPKNLVCAACGHEAPLSGWRFEDPWRFGNLCFSFESWSLRPEFIKAFEAELGRPVSVVNLWL
jgi:hypothetical protein